jgi:single-strand DNA-binding protein
VIARAVIIGRLVRDPENRTTATGKTVASFTVAVDSPFKDANGEKKTSFLKVTAWGQTAEYVGNYLSKGRLVAVDGRIESRKFTDKDGNNREMVEVVADNVQGLDRPKDDGGQGVQARPGATTPAPVVQDFDPWADE